MEAPTSNDYWYLPVVLTVVVTDINGDPTKTLRSINVEGEASVEVAGVPDDSIVGETPIIAENTVTLPVPLTIFYSFSKGMWFDQKSWYLGWVKPWIPNGICLPESSKHCLGLRSIENVNASAIEG